MVGVRGLGGWGCDKHENVCMWLLHILQTEADVCGPKIPLRICLQRWRVTATDGDLGRRISEEANTEGETIDAQKV